MDEQRARIHDDLRGLIEGELLFEPLDRAPYSADAGLFQIDPLGVAVPRHEADLIALVRYAAEQSIPIHPRGAGTGRTGGCLGPGLVIDFSRHFRRIVSVGDDRVVAQGGAVLDRLRAELRGLGRRIGFEVEGCESHTIGGLIGLDPAGWLSRATDSLADRLASLRVVFANGEPATLQRCPRPKDDPTTSFRDAVAHRLDVLLNWNAEHLETSPAAWKGRRAGFALESIARPGGGLDLIRPLAGAEGTLALITEATFRTEPSPAASAVVLLLFGRLIDAAEAVPACLETRPSACELFDWRTLSLARDAEPSLREHLAEHAQGILVVGFEGGSATEVNTRARELAGRLRRLRSLSAAPILIGEASECRDWLRLREIANPLMMRQRDSSRPVAPAERLRLPPTALPDLVGRVQGLMKSWGVGWTLDAHAAVAEVRVRPFLDLSAPVDRDRFARMGDQLREVVLDLGGSVDAGLGPGRIATLRRMQGTRFNTHRELKYAFDPQNLLNPGKVVGDEATAPPLVLRTVPGPGRDPLPIWDQEAESSNLRWTGRSRVEHVAACDNCGVCRSQEPTLRMCPSFRGSFAEANAPRGQIQILREIAAGRVDPRLWGSEEYKAQADLCLHCHLCEPECPSGVDVSSLMIEAKAAHVALHGLPPDDWMLSRIDVWSSLAGRWPLLFNTLMGNRTARWLLEHAFGLSRLRRLPRAQRNPFLRRAERLGLTRPRPHEPGPRAAYFVDIFANTFDPELAESVVALLRHAGVNVFVPKAQYGCGMSALVAGDLDRARDLVEANLRVLGNAVRDGYTIVCSEPTAALMFRTEAVRLTDDLDASLVASNTLDVGQYLAGLAQRGDLRPPTTPIPAHVGYHQPCHLRALGAGTPALDLLRTIPDLEVTYINRGCSGMAGTFGLAARNFRASLRAGRGLRVGFRDPRIQVGSTECAACRMQMEQSSPKRTIHPIKLLALAYGLNPSLRRHLDGPKVGRRLSF